jgi:Uma2 family endonuclease
LTSTKLARAELIGGQQFTRPERTPHLRALVDHAQAALEAGMRLVARSGCVLRDADVLLTVAAVAIPDLALYRGPTCEVPDLIVEYRAESTDRLFFGPKRLAYARARVPELWFVDPSKSQITVLRLGAALDYPWPAETLGPADLIRSSAIPSLALPAKALLHAT